MLICYISSFGEISVQIFHIFFQIIGLLVFCICSGFKSLSEIHFENIFCQSETCLSTLNFFCDQFSSVQFSHSVVRLLGTPWAATCQASVSITNSCSLLKLMSIESVMPSNHLILCRSLLLLPSIFPNIKIFSDESVLHIRWPKHWSFTFSISPSLFCVLIYNICFSLSDLVHSVWQSVGPSMSPHMEQFCSILWLINIPLYTCAKSLLLSWWTFTTMYKIDN